jgi:hypothetical protein
MTRFTKAVRKIHAIRAKKLQTELDKLIEQIHRIGKHGAMSATDGQILEQVARFYCCDFMARKYT